MKITVEPSASHVRRANRDKSMVVRCRQRQYDTYPKPDLPESNTTDQQASRQAWSRSCTAWTGLSADEKASWNAYAAANESAFSRRSAEPLTGYRLFQSAAGNRQILGLEMPNEAPAQRPPEALTVVELLPASEANTLRLRVQHKLKAGPFRVVVSMSPATLRSSRKADRRSGRHVRGWGADSTAPLPKSGGEITFSGCRYAIEPGQRFGVWLRVIRESDGLSSPEQFLDFTREAPEMPTQLSSSVAPTQSPAPVEPESVAATQTYPDRTTANFGLRKPCLRLAHGQRGVRSSAGLPTGEQPHPASRSSRREEFLRARHRNGQAQPGLSS